MKNVYADAPPADQHTYDCDRPPWRWQPVLFPAQRRVLGYCTCGAVTTRPASTTRR